MSSSSSITTTSSAGADLIAGILLVGVRHWSIEEFLPHHSSARSSAAHDYVDDHDHDHERETASASARLRRHHERELGLPPGGTFQLSSNGRTSLLRRIDSVISGGGGGGRGDGDSSRLFAAVAVVWLVVSAIRWVTSSSSSSSRTGTRSAPTSTSTSTWKSHHQRKSPSSRPSGGGFSSTSSTIATRATSILTPLLATITFFSLCQRRSLSTGSIVTLSLFAQVVWQKRVVIRGDQARLVAGGMLAMMALLAGWQAGFNDFGSVMLLLAYAVGVSLSGDHGGSSSISSSAAAAATALATGLTSAALAWIFSASHGSEAISWTPRAVFVLALLGLAIATGLPAVGTLVGDPKRAVSPLQVLGGVIAAELVLDVFQPVDIGNTAVALALTYLLHRCSTSVLPSQTFISQAWSELSRSNESRRIFYFLVLNLAYMLVQVAWGIWTNSLGLISDAIHMGFDCLSLGLGLVASVMSKRPADGSYTFGWGRLQALSGFTNGVFLVLISLFIIVEALQRLVTPPEIRNIRQLLAVSTGGLVVNLVGMYATGHHHHHHGGGGGDHHHHDHGDSDHGHNMRGVFLHVLADTLGSAGVIASTLLISYTGWTIFDPLASLFMAAMIAASVAPLIQDTYAVLALENDPERARRIDAALAELSSVDALTSYGAARFWPRDSGSLVGTIHVRLASKPDVSVARSMAQIEALLMARVPGLEEVVVQVERDGATFCSCTTQYQ